MASRIVSLGRESGRVGLLTPVVFAVISPGGLSFDFPFIKVLTVDGGAT